MNNNKKITDTFIALNYLHLAENYKSKINNKNHKINIQKIWDVLLNPEKYNDSMNMLFANKTFSEIFYKILKNNSLFFQTKLIAASSEQVKKRVSDDFEVEIVESNKNKNIVYIIVKLLKDVQKPISNLYVICNDEISTIEIPLIIDNQFQIILQKDHKFYNLISHPEAEIFIR